MKTEHTGLPRILPQIDDRDTSASQGPPLLYVGVGRHFRNTPPCPQTEIKANSESCIIIRTG